MQSLRIVPMFLAACLQAGCDAPGGPGGPGGPGAAPGAPAPVAAPASAAAPAPVVARPAGPAAPPAASAPATPAPASGLPVDVVAFRTEREQCDHFRGEEGYDAQRRQEIARQLDRFCKGTDARLAALRSKYASHPRVIESLRDFEDQVE